MTYLCLKTWPVYCGTRAGPLANETSDLSDHLDRSQVKLRPESTTFPAPFPATAGEVPLDGWRQREVGTRAPTVSATAFPTIRAIASWPSTVKCIGSRNHAEGSSRPLLEPCGRHHQHCTGLRRHRPNDGIERPVRAHGQRVVISELIKRLSVA